MRVRARRVRTALALTRAHATAHSGYSQRKITENIDCEIFGVVLEEAQDSYKEDVVKAMSSESVEDMERNLAELRAWLAARGV